MSLEIDRLNQENKMSLKPVYWLNNNNTHDEYLKTMKEEHMAVDFARYSFDKAYMDYMAPFDEAMSESPFSIKETPVSIKEESNKAPSEEPVSIKEAPNKKSRAERHAATRNKKRKFLKGDKKNPPNLFKKNGTYQIHHGIHPTHIENGWRKYKGGRAWFAEIQAVMDERRGAGKGVDWEEEIQERKEDEVKSLLDREQELLQNLEGDQTFEEAVAYIEAKLKEVAEPFQKAVTLDRDRNLIEWYRRSKASCVAYKVARKLLDSSKCETDDWDYYHV